MIFQLFYQAAGYCSCGTIDDNILGVKIGFCKTFPPARFVHCQIFICMGMIFLINLDPKVDKAYISLQSSEFSDSYENDIGSYGVRREISPN